MLTRMICLPNCVAIFTALLLFSISFCCCCCATVATGCDPHREFLCDNGWCIVNSERCNDVDDCGDASDERDCDVSWMTTEASDDVTSAPADADVDGDG